MSLIKAEIIKILNKAGVKGEFELVVPPKSEMGDFSFACFELAKAEKKNPVEVAKEIVKTVGAGRDLPVQILEKITAIGPYVNFYLNSAAIAEVVLKEVKDKNFGKSKIGDKKKIMVEFAHPNTHKAFHIGHLRNAITGESMVRILENAGYKVVRANYQGDVGMHIAKCLWGIWHNNFCHSEERSDEESLSQKMLRQRSLAAARDDKLETIDDKVKFLGEAYVRGSTAFEEDEKVKEEIIEINDKIYSQDKSIKELYKTTRKWSLAYFDKIYKRLGTRFDRLYFESETFKKGKEIVLKFLSKGVFIVGEGGAIVFEGSKYGLHDRVFVNSKGFPTYEAKDLALAELQFKEYKPEMILHLVAKEQTEYFKVMFKSLEFTFPKSKEREKHLEYGWVSLKEGKMSSRTGQVVLGEWLLDEVKNKIAEIMKDNKFSDKEKVIEKIAIAAVKYSMLKTGVRNDIKFDFNESISLTGDSGPYLLYIVARINSILAKSQNVDCHSEPRLSRGEEALPQKTLRQRSLAVARDDKKTLLEKSLLLHLSEFSTITKLAAESFDPSKIAKYLLDLAQKFNEFYSQCPILQAEEETQKFRLRLIKEVRQVMERGLYLLGIETVKEM